MSPQKASGGVDPQKEKILEKKIPWNSSKKNLSPSKNNLSRGPEETTGPEDNRQNVEA